MKKKLPIIATPISHIFEQKLKSLKIIKSSDCLEVRERNIKLSFPNEFLFHFDVDLTLPWDQKQKEYIYYCIKQKKKLKLVTFQSTRCCLTVNIVNGVYHPRGELFTPDQMIKFSNENINWLKSFLKSNVSIGLENNNYFPTPAYKFVTDGDFISKVLTSNNIYFLLDIAHAIITSRNRNIAYSKYLKSLPLKKIIQLHICSPFVQKKGLAIDSHDIPK